MKKLLFALLFLSAFICNAQNNPPYKRSSNHLVADDSLQVNKSFTVLTDTSNKKTGSIGFVSGIPYYFNGTAYVGFAGINGTGYIKVTGTSLAYVTSIGNSDLANSTITIQGTSTSLGGSVNPINGTGFVKATGTTVSYDGSTYLTTTGSGTGLSGVALLASVNTLTANNIFQPTVSTGTGATAGMQIAANSLTTGNALDISSTSITTGSLLNINIPSATVGTLYNGITLSNPVIATSVSPSSSPNIIFDGQGWKTNSVAASQDAKFRMYLLPTVNGSSSVVGSVVLESSMNGGAYTNQFLFSSGGVFTTPSGIVSNGSNIQQTNASIATTSTDGLIIRNNTAATSGVPVQYSSRLRFTGAAWNTGGTPASNADDWIIENQPVSGNPTSENLVFSSQLFAGGYNKEMTLGSSGLLAPVHLTGLSSAPTIAAGAGAGGSPTVTITGTDVGGYITVLTGSSPTASATVATVTFNVAFASAPRCVIIQNANANADLLGTTSNIYVNQSGIATTTFALTVGSVGLGATTTYQWYYFIVQ